MERTHHHQEAEGEEAEGVHRHDQADDHHQEAGVHRHHHQEAEGAAEGAEAEGQGVHHHHHHQEAEGAAEGAAAERMTAEAEELTEGQTRHHHLLHQPQPMH